MRWSVLSSSAREWMFSMSVRISRLSLLACSAALSACAAQVAEVPPAPAVPVATEVQILAVNDFHGALEPPKLLVPAKTSAGADVEVPAGGAAYLAGAAKALR